MSDRERNNDAVEIHDVVQDINDLQRDADRDTTVTNED